MTKVSADLDKFGETMSEELLAEIVLSKRGKEDAHAALKEIARRGGPRRHDVFRRVLDDTGQDASARNTAAIALGSEPVPENRESLLRHLGEKNASVFRRVVQALGRIGDEDALEQLEKAQPPDDGPARRAHAFAKSLIAYRLRLDRNRLATPAEQDLLKVEGGITFETKKPEPERLQRAIREARKDLPAVSLATEGAIELDCLSEELLLFFTDEFWRPQAQQTLLERGALFMVLLKDDPALDRHFLENYFFTHPSKGREEVALLGTRPGGDLTFAGHLKILPAGFSLSLKSVVSRYAPAIDVSAHYEGTWKVERAITSTTVSAGESAARQPLLATRPSSLQRA
ncbi:MAG TPA: HEAT repeat domain-containing protein [Pyrinomonadaceae bacterium]